MGLPVCRNVRQTPSPFIFDDPISSLDQFWEECVIDRLTALSESRQVIVLKHRLSLLGLIAGKASASHVINIRREPWGTGQPGDAPIYGKSPEGALNKLRNERLPRARKVLQEEGAEAYYPLAKAICSDYRILVERIVEFVLLSDIVQRHRPNVKTLGNIHNLAKIGAEDCDLIDQLMTK